MFLSSKQCKWCWCTNLMQLLLLDQGVVLYYYFLLSSVCDWWHQVNNGCFTRLFRCFFLWSCLKLNCWCGWCREKFECFTKTFWECFSNSISVNGMLDYGFSKLPLKSYICNSHSILWSHVENQMFIVLEVMLYSQLKGPMSQRSENERLSF